jgi:hypothetical protein
MKESGYRYIFRRGRWWHIALVCVFVDGSQECPKNGGLSQVNMGLSQVNLRGPIFDIRLVRP